MWSRRSIQPVLALSLLWGGAALASEPAPAQDPTEIFEQALDQLSSGNLGGACRTLETLPDRYPDTPESRWAEQLGSSLFRLSPGSCLWARTPGGDIHKSGTTELVVSQAVVTPIWLASAPSIWGAPPRSATGPVLLSFAGLGLGIGGTYAAARRFEPTSGQAMAIYTGELLGGWYGIWLAGQGRSVEEADFLRAGHAGVLLGGLGGIALGATTRPSSGQMALVRGGAIWGTTYGGLVAMVVQLRSERGTLAALGIGTTLGIGGGVLAGQLVDLRRGQVNTVNLGGYAGTVVGLGSTVLIAQATEINAETGALLVGFSTTVGLVAGALLVDFDARPRTPNLGLRAGPPIPTLLAAGDGRQVPGLTMSGMF